MFEIKNEEQYDICSKKIDQFVDLVGDNTNENDPNYIELMLYTDAVEKYDKIHYSFNKNSLTEEIEVLKLENDK
ncbi:hypothetical protein KMW28_00835 [Flammeovirga yaeyamensis]|uniref:Uncharacterized protein n=1 Tax=Flammeovirga yaeyamensis TaxID=367791 RepID=A0AAX1N3Y1_9BACT|nr:XRE family transcriptional regulator [Flammeovirga yaeyamensis]MBB3699628.1 hypothetical protein [Flammeovirga yaeyamensis]QWG02160.1 hypothetical protein KMW28_00835 [Flammeovirga yaeyamensis]